MWLLRWSRRNVLDRLVWNLAVIMIVSADKATSFTVPKILIFGDVVLAFKFGTRRILRKNTDITHKFMIYTFAQHYAINPVYAYYAEIPYFRHIYAIKTIMQYSRGWYVPLREYGIIVRNFERFLRKW